MTWRDLVRFFELDAIRESLEGRLFTGVTAAVMLGVFWGVFCFTESYLISALAACLPPIAYIWRLAVTLGRERPGSTKSAPRPK